MAHAVRGTAVVYSPARRPTSSVELLLQVVRDPVHHDAHVAWHVAAVRVYQGDGQRLAGVLRQDLDHVAGGDAPQDADARRLDDAEAGQARRVVRVGAVHGDQAAHRPV